MIEIGIPAFSIRLNVVCREVVEFLLGKGPDLSYADPGFGATARGAALYNGHTEIAALIDQASRPVPG